MKLLTVGLKAIEKKADVQVGEVAYTDEEPDLTE